MRLFFTIVFVLLLVGGLFGQVTDAKDKRVEQLDTVLVGGHLNDPIEIMNKVVNSYHDNHDLNGIILDFTHEARKLYKAKDLLIKVKRLPLSKDTVKEVQSHLDSLSRLYVDKSLLDATVYKGSYAPYKQRAMFTQVSFAGKATSASKYHTIHQVIPDLKKVLGKYIDDGQRYTIKSGWFRIEKDTDLRIDTSNTRTIQTNKGNHTIKKDLRLNLGHQLSSLLYQDDFVAREMHIDSLFNTNWYEYRLKEYVELDSIVHYHLNFLPKHRKAMWEGDLVVDARDFGLIKLNYHFAPKEHGQKVNFKWLLGVKFKEYLYEYMITYKKDKLLDKYIPQSAVKQRKEYYYFNRPFMLKLRKSPKKHKFHVTSEGEITHLENLHIKNARIFPDTIKKGNVVSGVSRYKKEAYENLFN